MELVKVNKTNGNYLIELNNNLNRYGYRGLYHCYNNFSIAKEYVYNRCIELVNKYNGFDFTITSYNCQTFTFMFKFVDNEKNLCVAKITKNYNKYQIIK